MGLDCKIFLENYNEATYRTGDQIKGKVNYTVHSEINVTDIVIALKARAQCAWKQHHGKSYTYYKGVEKLFTSKQSILEQHQTGSSHTVIPPGSYMHDFQFILPEQTPYTYEKDGENFIRYSLRIYFYRPEFYKFNNKFTKILFVKPYVDLSTSEHFTKRQPTFYTMTRDQKALMIFYKVGQMTATVHVPRSAFVAGEHIPVSVEIANKTTLTLRGVRVKLLKLRTFTSSPGRQKQKKYSVAKSAIDSEVSAGESVVLTCGVDLPPDVVPSLMYCRVIAIQYALRVRVLFPGLRLNSDILVPLTIGSAVEPSPTTSSACCLPTAPEAPLGYEDPPPSYWEIMQEGKGKIKKRSDEEN